MKTDIAAYDYYLPDGCIAQAPATPRESARLLVLSRNHGTWNHGHISDFPSLLKKGDVLVVNNSKVFKARLHGMAGTVKAEVFLVRPTGNNTWLAIGKPGKKLKTGTVVTFAPDFSGLVGQKHEDGSFDISFRLSDTEVIDHANTYGEVPTPPYIKHPTDTDAYQTAYAKIVGSVAAPTAGFHLTLPLLDTLRKQGVSIIETTLHVGLGTFIPVKTRYVEDHTMHSEWVHISEGAAQAITTAKAEGRRIVAVGTTTVRTLEGVATLHHGSVKAYSGFVNLFITPGFSFSVVDALLTNFHLPKSTLIILVSAFAGRETILSAYRDAIQHNYRFYSFGDAMFIS